MKVEGSAPGKTILIGEHFVVENEPAIAVAIGLRAHVMVEEVEEEKIEIISEDLGIREVFNEGSKRINSPLYPLYYGIRQLLDNVGIKESIRLKIKSEIPVAAGMGSSAAVAVASIAAVSRLLGVRLSEEEISRFAYMCERIVHGKPSGIDNTIATYGGVIAFRRNEGFLKLRGDTSKISLILADSGIPRNTGNMVMRVLKLKGKYPSVMEPLYHTAGRLAIEAGKAIEEGDFAKLGELMNINHGLLSAIGVSNLRLEKLVYRAREAGALGSKITGAGGGGFIVALCEKGAEVKIREALKEISRRVYVTEVEERGVITRLID